MSDTTQGPGWWQASDGKWYPPAVTSGPSASGPASSQRLASGRVVIQSPTSLAGSARRIWKMTDNDNAVLRWLLLVPVAVVLVAVAWIFALSWLVLWGIFLVPWRLIRRGSRKRKQADLRHRELMARMPPRVP